VRLCRATKGLAKSLGRRGLGAYMRKLRRGPDPAIKRECRPTAPGAQPASLPAKTDVPNCGKPASFGIYVGSPELWASHRSSAQSGLRRRCRRPSRSRDGPANGPTRCGNWWRGDRLEGVRPSARQMQLWLEGRRARAVGRRGPRRSRPRSRAKVSARGSPGVLKRPPQIRPRRSVTP
jgi:hypothetical protein